MDTFYMYMPSDMVREKKYKLCRIFRQNAERIANFVESTLDCAEISTVNRI